MMRRIFVAFLVLVFLTQCATPVFAREDRRIGMFEDITQSTFDTSFRTLSQGAGKGLATEKAEDILRGKMIGESVMQGLSYQVHVLGEVASPGTYRIAASDRLSEVLGRAGSILQRGSERFIEIRRRGEGTRKVDLFLFQTKGRLEYNPYLLDNDVVFVPLKKNVAQIVGPVKRPSVYEIKDEKSVEDLVELAGGFTAGVDGGGVVRVIRFVDFKKGVLEMQNTAEERGKVALQSGDIVVIPHILIARNKFDYNVLNLPGDTIFYPSFEDRVFVLGGVFQPGPYEFNPYYNLQQYLTFAGGTTQLAKKKIYIIRPDGKKVRGRNDSVINPGDTIVVGERRLAPESWLSLAATVVSMASTITTMIVVITQ